MLAVGLGCPQELTMESHALGTLGHDAKMLLLPVVNAVSTAAMNDAHEAAHNQHNLEKYFRANSAEQPGDLPSSLALKLQGQPSSKIQRKQPADKDNLLCWLLCRCCNSIRNQTYVYRRIHTKK